MDEPRKPDSYEVRIAWNDGVVDTLWDLGGYSHEDGVFYLFSKPAEPDMQPQFQTVNIKNPDLRYLKITPVWEVADA